MTTVVALVGPTGAGKTDLAIHLARRLHGEIVSVDSRLLYRGMDIGTAKPTAAQRAEAPHHLVDVAEPDESWSLGRFRREVYAAVEDILRRGRRPVLAGGTGQYMTAVLDGWTPPEVPPDPGLRAELEGFAKTYGIQALHDRLAAVDPESAAAIDPRNVRRVVRAIEIYDTTGVPRHELGQTTAVPFEALRIGLRMPRPELYARLDARLDKMIAEGWVDEVRGLMSRGFSPELPAFSAIGYRPMAAHVRGEINLDQAVAQIRQATRRFVRHQANWFRQDDRRIRWFDVAEGYEDTILGWLEDALGKRSAARPAEDGGIGATPT